MYIYSEPSKADNLEPQFLSIIAGRGFADKDPDEIPCTYHFYGAKSLIDELNELVKALRNDRRI